MVKKTTKIVKSTKKTVKSTKRVKKLTKSQLNKESLKLNQNELNELSQIRVCIVIDTREDKVKPFFDNFISDVNRKFNFQKLTTVVKQITTGDFCIIVNGKPRLMIERKTWADLSASIKDKRINGQTEKMLKFREENPECQLIYIIEGRAFISKDTKIARIPYNNLIAKLRHSFLRDNIAHIQTKSELHTAEMIVDFANDIYNIEKELRDKKRRDEKGKEPEVTKEPISENDSNELSDNTEIEGGDEINDSKKIEDSDEINDSQVIEESNVNIEIINKDDKNDEFLECEVAERNMILSEIPDSLTERHSLSVERIHINIIRQIPKVGEPTANILCSKYTIQQILLKEISKEELSTVMLPSGTKIGLKKAELILSGVDLIGIQQKILTEIDGINKNTSIIIISSYKLPQIIRGEVPVKTLANIQKTPTRKLGPVVAQRIIDIFTKKN